MSAEDLPNNSKQTIDTTNVKVFEECYQDVISRTVINTSTGGQVISLGDGEEAEALQGIVLYPGGTYNDSADGQYKPSRAQLNAISNLAGGTIAMKERIGIRRGGF